MEKYVEIMKEYEGIVKECIEERPEFFQVHNTYKRWLLIGPKKDWLLIGLGWMILKMLAPDWFRLNGPKNSSFWLVQENAGLWLV